jgi:hypothetical protein
VGVNQIGDFQFLGVDINSYYAATGETTLQLGAVLPIPASYAGFIDISYDAGGNTAQFFGPSQAGSTASLGSWAVHGYSSLSSGPFLNPGSFLGGYFYVLCQRIA